MKTLIVGSKLGSIGQSLRDRLELYRAAGATAERLGTIANDQLARTLLERLCSPGEIFIDVGAHIGSVIDGVKRNSKPSEIHAIEAIPYKVEALRRNFPFAKIHECAVGEIEGETSFFIDTQRTGYSSLDGSRLDGKAVEITVPIRRLDSLVPATGIGVIKIDVEGAELGVLRGAEATVAGSPPTIMFESGAGAMAAYPKEALWQWLDDHDYAVLVPNRVAHLDPGLALEGFVESHLYPRRTTNYFAVPREKREAVRARARMVTNLKG